MKISHVNKDVKEVVFYSDIIERCYNFNKYMHFVIHT